MDKDKTRSDLRAIETKKLEEDKIANPDLFPEKTWIDDNETLEKLGIHIPGKEKLPDAYLKLLPSDFIVEEVSLNGDITNIKKEDGAYPESDGETVYATLVKCGLSTLEAVEELAKLLNTTKDKIQYAGIKDKNAITSQQISIRGISKDKVQDIHSPYFFLKDIHIGKGVIQKGGLKGNRFTILLRMEGSEEEKIKNSISALKRIKEEGFYNFFYLQRFGSPRLNNYKWGLSILKGDYEKAVIGMLTDEGLRESPYFLNMRREIMDLMPDWQSILKKLEELPLIFSNEIKVIAHLINHPQDFAGALRKIEDQVMLWVSAVSSLLYNRKISSFIMAGIEPPHALPLFLSTDKNDWLPYAEDMESVGIFPPNFYNLRPFRSISLAHKDIVTKDRAEVHKVETVPEGLIVQFTLGKGEYATTFLSHFVNLMNGKPPIGINENEIDTKGILGEEGKETLNSFKSLNIIYK